MRRESKRLAEHPSQLRAEAARTQKGDWHIASLSRNRLHCSPGLGWAEVGTQFFQQFGKFISGLVQIPSQRSHGLEVATGSSPQAEIDSSGKHRFQCSELFCHYQRGMVGQHETPPLPTRIVFVAAATWPISTAVAEHANPSIE